MDKTRMKVLLVILLIAVASIYVLDLLSPYDAWPSSLSSHYTDSGLYRISPRSILVSLEKGNIDVFLPDPRPLDDRLIGPILYTEPILWSQSDHLKISQAVNNFVWKDTLDDWELFTMSFNIDCQEGLNGLPRSTFKYFKTVVNNGKISNTWREFEIDARYSYVAWGGGGINLPHPMMGLQYIDLSRLKVNAVDAIRIAEENGGLEARLRVQNQCNIFLLLMPERFRGWVVDYGYSSGFEIQIDQYTGEVIK
jgi:hypothetical protein